jgi:hypothetical protein
MKEDNNSANEMLNEPDTDSAEEVAANPRTELLRPVGVLARRKRESSSRRCFLASQSCRHPRTRFVKK